MLQQQVFDTNSVYLTEPFSFQDADAPKEAQISEEKVCITLSKLQHTTEHITEARGGLFTPKRLGR